MPDKITIADAQVRFDHYVNGLFVSRAHNPATKTFAAADELSVPFVTKKLSDILPYFLNDNSDCKPFEQPLLARCGDGTRKLKESLWVALEKAAEC